GRAAYRLNWAVLVTIWTMRLTLAFRSPRGGRLLTMDSWNGRNCCRNACIFGMAAWAPAPMRGTPLLMAASCQSVTVTAATRRAHLSWLAATFCAQTFFCRAAAAPGACVTDRIPASIFWLDWPSRAAQSAATAAGSLAIVHSLSSVTLRGLPCGPWDARQAS